MGGTGAAKTEIFEFCLPKEHVGSDKERVEPAKERVESTVGRFQADLRSQGLAANTVDSYTWALNDFLSRHGEANADTLSLYRDYLLNNFKPKTANIRLVAINKYLKFIGNKELELKHIKIQQKSFLENVISNADYVFLKSSLKNDGNMPWFFVVWFLGATGARVSELIQFKVEHVFDGVLDIYGKGSKYRRLYIPKKLGIEARKWLEESKRVSGHLFVNSHGERISTRGISQQLKNYAKKYGLDPRVVYPHSFRHMYAKNFLARLNDISFLADLMGHESIQTTRIYLRRTASEQRVLVDEIIDW
jgi:site-specific recombinase XerD